MNMDDFYNHIQYVVPENSEILFSILPETRDVSIKLLDGVADIYENDKRTQLPLQEYFSIQFWDCLFPRLKTKTGCNFLVRGNHYVSSAIQHGLVEENTLFTVSEIDHSYSFVLEKEIQLQIFPVKSSEKHSSVTIINTRGAPEISGFKLSHEKTYLLSPFVPVLLKSSDEKPYSIHVQGLDRKVQLCIRDENHHKFVNDVKDHIFVKYFLEKQFKHISPTILVIGPKNAGKTSFCQLLVNETLENNITPIYVDLNVKRNSSVPGSLSFSVVESRIDSTLELNYNFQRLLHYGSMVLTSANMGLYYFLVKKMARLLSFHLNYNNKEKFLSVIDTDGYHGEDKTAIEFFLKAFAFDLVVYIGDEHYYENLKKSALEYMPSEFIPKLSNAQQPSDSYEGRFYQHRIQRYFFGPNLSTRNTRTIPLCLLTIYTISASPNITSEISEKASDYNIERVDLNSSVNPNLLKHLFGVSASKKLDLHAMVEIKYYVYFTNIDITTKMATVMVPESENFNGGILLMGHVKKLEDSDML